MEWAVRRGFSGKMAFELRPTGKKAAARPRWKAEIGHSSWKPLGREHWAHGASENNWGNNTPSRGKWPTAGGEVGLGTRDVGPCRSWNACCFLFQVQTEAKEELQASGG